jgi:RNA polymerase sigma-70 factor (ECF subfamily)
VSLDLVDALELPRSGHLLAVRADLLRRLGRTAEAAGEYEAAAAAAGNEPERAFLLLRRASLGMPSNSS